MRFKKGDRVRYVGKNDYHSVGHIGKSGVVSAVDVCNFTDVKFDDGTHQRGCYPNNLELVEQPKFNVGDKVKEAPGSDLGLSEHWAGYWAKPGDARVTEFFVTGVDREWIWYSAKPGGTGPCVTVECLELVDWDHDPRKPTSHECAAAQVDNMRDEYGPVGKAVAAGNDNGKPKFKVGDFLTKKTGGWRAEGYEVKKIDGKTVYLDDTHGDTAGYDLNDRDFVVVKAVLPTTPAIVCLIENGQPKPADRPHVHPSRTAAGTEATRLARKFPGQEFGVYELVDTKQEAKPAYKHEWQRLAADGEKIYAIKELRSMTGMTLKGAKEAVEHWLAVGEPYSRLAA